ncbi:GMC family oxidoreductase N-terminal domain-containing protein [Cupriavidus basilensis]
MLGGTSQIMGMFALRGRPDDYDDWARQGATGWAGTTSCPTSASSKPTRTSRARCMAMMASVPIRREPPQRWSPLATRLQAVVQERNLGHVADMNADFGDGHGTLPISRFDNKRGSAGICYLDAAARARDNLSVQAGTTVTRLLTARHEGMLRCVGVVATDAQGITREIRARRVLLAAGALRSPALLLRSGIRPAQDLAQAGIAPVLERLGVGRNLQDHAILYVVSFLRPGGRERPGVRPPARPRCDGVRARMAVHRATWACMSAAGCHGMRWATAWHRSRRS